MASRKLKRLLFSLLALLVFIISFVFFSINTFPVNLVNRFLPIGTQLNLTGNLQNGQIQSVTFTQNKQSKTLSLQCNWQKVGIKRFTVNCQTPIQLSATVEFGLFGSVSAQSIHVAGQLSDIEPWLSALDIPKGLGGQFELSITTAEIADGILQTLDLNATVTSLRYFSQEVMPLITVTTQQSHNPIVLDSTAKGDVRLFLESTIDNNQYITQGEIQSKQLKHFQPFLKFLGKQRRSDTWAIDMRGQLF